MGESLYIGEVCLRPVGPFEYKISSFWLEIPGFNPRTFGSESKHARNELPSASVLKTLKFATRLKQMSESQYFIVITLATRIKQMGESQYLIVIKLWVNSELTLNYWLLSYGLRAQK